MKITELFFTALRSLLTNRRRSILTVLGIVIGIASVITIISLGKGVEKATLKNLQASSSGKQSTVVDYYADDLNSTASGFEASDLALINASQTSFGLVKADIVSDNDGSAESEASINGADQNVTVKLLKHPSSDLEILSGHNISQNNIMLADPVALISKKLATSFYSSVNQALNTSVTINGISYQVIGVFKEDMGLDDVAISKTTYERSNNGEAGNKLKLTFNRGENVSKQTKKIVSLLNKQGSHHLQGSYEHMDMGAILKGVGSVINGLTYFISAIAGISLFIAGIGVMNMMYISVSERTQEIGIRLAIGASPKSILLQFLLEAVLLTGMGGVLGFGIGCGLAWLISLFLPFRAVVGLESFILAFGVSAIVGIVFGIFPARQASKKNLIDILK
ncbi:ABC transporter permease [Sporolactobacillus shoreicorticis]|uniref:ABC transporter permease n=1 Tax=Sporolactobacillus shoreicorticis TaxID=1923877 RepID=A0ABW5S784_9BACL|nr:ABC transporter permease [Sporolactobacillus shoreicorticis]MCO7128201.1 ABC transporter permease [Sporolactobacillus shoreicorticis]